MNLVCPSCSAEYQVPASAIGAKGRMVRCASCNSEWFQTPEANTAAEPAAAASVPAPVSKPAPKPAPSPVSSLRAVVSEPKAKPEGTKDRGLSALAGFSDDDADDVVPERSYNRPRSVPVDDSFADLGPDAVGSSDIYYDVEPEARPVVDSPVLEQTAVRSTRKTDMDELTSSLRATEDAGNTKAGGAFLAGFATVTLISLILIAVYVKAPEIAAVAPAIKGPLALYGDLVDQGRMAISMGTSGG